MIENFQEQIKKIDEILSLTWSSCASKYKTYETSLKDLISFANTGADAIQKAPIVNHRTNYKCVRVGDFTNNRDYSEWAFCELKQNIFNQYKLLANDILITRTASIGLTKFINSNLNAVYNNGIIRIRANNKILPLILYLLCSSNDFNNHIKGFEGASSTRPNMKIEHLLSYRVAIPSIENQKKIINKISNYMNLKSLVLKKVEFLQKSKQILLSKYF